MDRPNLFVISFHKSGLIYVVNEYLGQKNVFVITVFFIPSFTKGLFSIQFYIRFDFDFRFDLSLMRHLFSTLS